MIRCNLNRDLWQARQLSITVCHFPTETFCVCAVLKDDITHTRRDTNFIADNISAAGQHLKRELRHPSLGDNNAKLHQLIPDKPFHRVADDYIQTERGRMSNWHETRSRCDAWKHHTSDWISSLASIFHKNRLGDIKHAIFAHTHTDTHSDTHTTVALDSIMKEHVESSQLTEWKQNEMQISVLLCILRRFVTP